ncbi:MAG: hypothetical protein QM805_26060 [Pseudomonas sp.]|uniref:hypothetical protein n=1 Tax=Pseudomonas TaxID=286 RepID=UPI000A747980|nr:MULTISPECIES: hypothetical protein [Pseudomonas]MBV7582481.1 hypothetical protein [Pseudomonas sp. PDM33]MDH1007542.1 hypothetical protein [Pseudomonas nicosulfuronedens]MDH2025813.1 hypothetical protein [Pseudomonas nicosulfuronedens]
MRRIFAAALLFLPLVGCVILPPPGHGHGGWRDGPRYYQPAPPPAYYGGPHQGWRR